ncbi:M48 family metallopeptidase [Deinococcus rubellus]|uniref:M48 family metallopeptidase n=1 Tax=Deinococcus rubellus TaxID=1889240 RepID=A0ABY5YH95_9DEIO|nr:SprT family zinc-dependent metalloprotease [Deinococcus rubellus]UWX64429.1 M48 family metallopeptidase [Deinococcus rubellus]
MSPPLPLLPGLSVGGLPVQLRRSQRRTVSLRVTAQGLTVYAPQRTEEAKLRCFVEDKRAWAERHLHRLQQREPVTALLTDGFVLPLLGEALILRALPDLKRAQQVGTDLHAPSAALVSAVEVWYKTEAPRHFTPIVQHFADQLGRGRPLSAVKITNAAGRWGSCTAAGAVRLHWRLLMAPPEILRYVAAHEVAHLAELNHSPRYWAEVARLFPEYRAAKHWLKEHGAALMQPWH